jgi:hypothetical protein
MCVYACVCYVAVPLPAAFQNLFSKTKETKDKDANLFATAPAAGSSTAVWSLAAVKLELEKLKADSKTHASDVTQIHNTLAQLYQLSHALEIAIANAQQTVSGERVRACV